MNTEEQSLLLSKIQKMEKGLENPNITDAIKQQLSTSIERAKEELFALSKAESDKWVLKKPVKDPVKKLTKKDFYAVADKTYPDLTRNGLNELPQNAYDVIYRQLMQLAEDQDLSKKEARDYVDSYVARHIPAGNKTVKPKKATKETKAEEKPVYSWKGKVDLKLLKPVVLHCQHYSLPIEKETAVRLKATGNESMVVTAQPGEHLIFDDKGYLVFIMNKGSFARKCNEGSTIDTHKKEKHLAEKAKTLEADLQAEQEKARKLEVKMKQLEGQLKDAIDLQLPAGTKVEEPISKPKEAKPKKRSVCTLAEAETGRRVAKITKFFLDEAEAWNSSTSTRKITKIMQTKGEKQEVIIEVADYKGFGTGLATLIGGKRNYYQLCVDSFNLTSVPKPEVGSYKIVIPADKMKEVYTTRGEKQYSICLKSYRELLKCSFEGSCTSTQQAKWKTLYQECGDLVAKLDKNPQVLRNFHVEVKNRRKNGEKYSDAMSRVAEELKKESSK